MFASFWDLYWCHESVSSTSTDTYHRVSILWLLLQSYPAQRCMTGHIFGVMSSLCSVSFHLDLVPYISYILHTALPYIGSYRSTQAAWPPARCSNGWFDVLDLTESVNMLESPGLVVTVLAASDWDLVNSVTELSYLTSSFQNGKVPFLICWVWLSWTSLVVFLVMISAELFSDLLNLTSRALLSWSSLM